MPTTFSWSFPQLDVAPSEGSLNDVIKTIHWRYTAERHSFEASDNVNVASAYGTVGLTDPDPEAFVPFEGLTEAKVIEWVSEALDVSEIEANLQAQLDALANPPVIGVAPPWSN